MPRTISLRTTLLATLGLIGLQIAVLAWFGQPAFCECGEIKLWEGVVESSGTSQQVSDWYTPSHIIHGFIFFGFLTLLFPRSSIGLRLLIALGIEIAWELIENTPTVIEHYRKQALARGYTGDSILNSVSDTLAMVLGFFAAARLPWWGSILIVLGLEAFTMLLIKDGLLLNIINLIHPLEFIYRWQAGG